MKLKIGLKQECALLSLKVQHLSEDVQELRARQVKLLRDRKRLEWILSKRTMVCDPGKTWLVDVYKRRDIDRLRKGEWK